MRAWIVAGTAAALAAAWIGTASAADAAERTSPKFTRADTDKDGKLSPSEFAALVGEQEAATKFAAADANRDGFVAPEEFTAAAKAEHREKAAQQKAQQQDNDRKRGHRRHTGGQHGGKRRK